MAITYGASKPGAGWWLITYESRVASPLAVTQVSAVLAQCGQPVRG